MMSTKRLTNIFLEHDGYVSDKWEQYLGIYDRELARFAHSDRPVRLLEIGVQNGGSLQIWEKYLPVGSNIVGVDIDERCAELSFTDSLRVVIANAGDAANLDRALDDARFDVIIDDGSHRSEDVIAAFASCFRRLEGGGSYVIEDVHASYRKSHGGGFRRPGTTIEWLKTLVDALHADHVEAVADITPIGPDELRALNRQIGRVAFYDSIAVIEKLPQAKEQPYRRVFTGAKAPIQDLTMIMAGADFPSGFVPNPADVLLSASTARQLAEFVLAQIATLNRAVAERDGQIATLNQAVAERDGQIASLNQAVAERAGQLASLNQAVAERAGQLASLTQTIAERNGALASVYTSTSWRLTAPYRWVGHQAKRVRHLWRIMPQIAAHSGGLWDACAEAMRVYRREGLVGIKHWLKQVQASSQPVGDVSSRAVNNDDDEKLTRQGHEYRSGQKLLQHRFQQSGPLSVFRVPGLSDRRINLVTDSVNAGSLFGGVATAIILAAQLAEARQARLRIITRTQRAQENNIAHILDQNGLSLSREMEFLFAPVADDSVEVDVGDGDFFLSSGPWWTTRSIMASVRNERILYLLQEDERMFYPYGDDRLRCEQTLRDKGIRFVVNTRLLFEHLVTEGFDNIRERGTWFEPAFPKDVFYPERKPSNGKRKFFFYARPNNLRNLFYLGVEVIEETILCGVIDLHEWEVVLVGKDVPTLTLGDGYQPQVQENLSWADYSALVRSVDLGLCLMYSPHPSYPPLDLVASGAVAVTNRYGRKQDLSAYSRNLICAELDRDSLVQGIETGVRLALDPDTREANYRNSALCRDWRQAFSEVVGQYAQEIC